MWIGSVWQHVGAQRRDGRWSLRSEKCSYLVIALFLLFSGCDLRFTPDGVTEALGGDQDGDKWSPCSSQADTSTCDCDDRDATIHPDAPEICDDVDDNCDGQVDEGFDEDGDGYPYPDAGCSEQDCDDSDSDVHPGAAESCDHIDQDCDAQIDEEVEMPYFADLDGDMFGNSLYFVVACAAPPGYVEDSTDCDDLTSGIYPGAPESCNGVDENCDSNPDDADSDSYCSVVSGGADCDDENSATYPDAAEICNGVDDNCDGTTDDILDQDGDGYTVCQGDCNDQNITVYPLATEICDGIDNDCDGVLDNGFDADGDGYTVCQGDCNDQNATVYPEAAESCDELDNDCGGAVDEGFDADGDGHTICGGDCSDDSPEIHPAALDDYCDGTDQNCDGKDDCPRLWGTLSTADADVIFESITTGDGVGQKVAAAGDTDGDLCPDLLFGAPTAEGNVGAVYLVPGCSNIASGGTILLNPGAASPKVIRYNQSNNVSYLGGDLAGGSDLDGDGLSDFLVGSRNDGSGGAYLIHGVESGESYPYNDVDDSWFIDAYSGYAGQGVALGGDFIGPPGGSGALDIVLGGPGQNYCGGTYGGAEIYPGPFGSESDLAPSAIGMALCGSSGDSSGELGESVSFVGDINGDGCDDLTISDPFDSDTKDGRGSVFLVYGPCTESDPPTLELNDAEPEPGYVAFVVASVSTSNRLGWSLGGTCHIGAGQDPVDPERPDLLFGDYNEGSNGPYAGAVFLVYGESLTADVRQVQVPSVDVNVPVVALYGESDSDEAGYSVACAGDVDGNGYDDILIGAPHWDAQEDASTTGSAYLLYAASDGSGIGNVVENKRTLNTAEVIIRASNNDTSVGYSVAGVGDVNGDGYADILIGATNVQGSGFGGAYLFYGGAQ